MIYFVKSNGLVKIGTSKNVYQRICELQTGSSSKLNVIAIMEGSFKTEKALHDMFSTARVGGEWFRYSREMKYFIKAIRRFPKCNNIVTLQYEANKMYLCEKAIRLRNKGNDKLYRRINNLDKETLDKEKSMFYKREANKRSKLKKKINNLNRGV